MGQQQPAPVVDPKDLEYVGFWPRLGATVIDLLLQMVVAVPLTYLIYGQLSAQDSMFQGPADILVNVVLPTAAVLAFWIYLGATPGKMAISARIVDATTGGPLTARQSVVRYLGYFVSLIPFGLGYFWVALDRRKQGWHDKLANSVVVRRTGRQAVKFEARKD